MNTEAQSRYVLLTGATGFVGRHVDAALEATDWKVRRATRDMDKARQPGWRYMDVEKPETLGPALEGCDAAIYLIHSIDSSDDYPEKEARGAQAFRVAAEQAGVRRIVYLGGVQPRSNPSRHLLSRVRTGELLRAGTVSTLELRAGLIVGAGGSSWVIVRDLAARLPAMLLPRWLKNFAWPVWIGDVCVAIVKALDLEQNSSTCFDLPGSERIAHEALLRRVAGLLDKRPPLLHVPLLSPRISSYWIALVTRAELSLAKELVEGLQSDLDPSQPIFWDTLSNYSPLELNRAIEFALRDQDESKPPSPILVEHLQERVRDADVATR